MEKLFTPYGPTPGETPLAEHPNPYFERKAYLSLNGPWDFCLDQSLERPAHYGESILVPFAVETPLSGVGRKVNRGDVLHYRKEICFPDEYVGKAGRIVFTAVDQVADVYLNGSPAAHHEGGYLPFEIAIPNVEERMTIELRVQDDTDSPIFPRGKQSSRPGGIWCTATSGIYGPVYFESLPKEGHIESLRVEPDYDERNLIIKARIAGDFSPIHVKCFLLDHLVGEIDIGTTLHGEVSHAADFFPWSPETPTLYRFVATMGRDEVQGVYSFRKVERRKIGPFERFLLNGTPVLLNGVLDQGYAPESGLTYPSYRAMEADLDFLKAAGFNFLRKHIKIEPLRFYYLCEKKGIMVAQDFVNGGRPYSLFYIALRPFLNFDVDDLSYRHLGREDKAGRDFFEETIEPTVKYLSPASSIVFWTLFNEGWGQFDSDRLASKLKSLDPTRLVDATSGWYDKGSGDFSSHHVYFRKVKLHNDGKRILSLSEFGGYSLATKGHLYSKKKFGYRLFKNSEALLAGLRKLYKTEIVPLVLKEGLSVLVLTQLSDVEEEINGLLSYDRKVCKINPALLKEEMDGVQSAFQEALREER